MVAILGHLNYHDGHFAITPYLFAKKLNFVVANTTKKFGKIYCIISFGQKEIEPKKIFVQKNI